MALVQANCAWINRSGSIIPVYGSLGSYVGHYGAGGEQIGSIYPNEMFTTQMGASYSQPYYTIRFRNRNGATATGYIETLPNGYTHDEAPWVPYQEPYHYYNSNGSALVSSASVTTGGKTYRKFTLTKSLRCIDRNGANAKYLPAGTLLLTDESTVGQSNPSYMIFKKCNTSGVDNGVWSDLYNDSYGYGFVDLGFVHGSEPSTRPIR